MSKLIKNSFNIVACHCSVINFSIKNTSPLIGNSLDIVSSIYATITTHDEDKISCTIYLVEKHREKYGNAK